MLANSNKAYLSKLTKLVSATKHGDEEQHDVSRSSIQRCCKPLLHGSLLTSAFALLTPTPTHNHAQAEAKVDQLKSDNTSAMIQHAQALMDLDSTRRSLLASHALRLTQALELPFTRVQECMPVAKRQALEEAIADESRRRLGVTRDADSEREEVRARTLL